MHRFFVPWALPAEGECAVTGDAAHRIGRVLRLAPGARVRLFDTGGREVEAEIASIGKASVTVRLAGELPPERPGPHIHLFPALIRPNRFEWLLEKATELGAASVVPIISERCQVRPAELGGAKAARWRRIVAEAAEQCGRRTLPDLRPPVPFMAALAGAPGLIVLPWEEERTRAPLLGEALRSAACGVRRAACEGPSTAEASIFVGPEGGFSEAEAAVARAGGAVLVSLGPRVLRAETAAIAALAIAVDAIGQQITGNG
jgi:16S rRNA (uracil1498-N3)-methyltransferase